LRSPSPPFPRTTGTYNQPISPVWSNHGSHHAPTTQARPSLLPNC